MWRKRISVAVIVLTSLLVVTVLLPMIQQAREEARRIQSRNNLKQIGIALINYESTFGGYPSGGVFNLEGRGFHSWTTMLIPFIESSPFYSFVDFNEPWDSTKNAGLFLNHFPVYENPSESTSVGKWEFPLAHYTANPNFMAVNSFTKADSFKNSKQMFVAGELNGDFLPWGCPYNWHVLEGLNSKPPTYGRSTWDGCQFAFVDGRVEFVSNDVSPDILELMRGEDLTGFKANSLNVHRPSEFPCPSDTIWISWRRDGTGQQFLDRTDFRGNVKSEKVLGK